MRGDTDLTLVVVMQIKRVTQEVDIRECTEPGGGVRDDPQVWGLSRWCIYSRGGTGLWAHWGNLLNLMVLCVFQEELLSQ